MMNLFFTLLTLVAGIFVGSAGIFSLKKCYASVISFLGWWSGILILFAGATALGFWCEGQANSHSAPLWLSTMTVVAILIFGIYLAIIYHLRIDIEIKKGLPNCTSSNLATLDCAEIFICLAFLLWGAIGLVSDLNSWISLASALGCSLIIVSGLWLSFHFALGLKYGFRNMFS